MSRYHPASLLRAAAPFFLLAVLGAVSAPSYGFSSLLASNSNCSGCHGNPLVGSTPVTGGVLAFGNNGKTLVGQTSSANFTISNTSTNQRGGFKGIFPSVTGEFSVNGSPTIVGDQGFLRAQKSVGPLPLGSVSEARLYSYKPTGRGSDSVIVKFTPLSSQFITGADASAAARTVSFQGQGVAPVASLNTSQANAGNVLVGASKLAKLTLQNVGDGNLSGLGASSNLNGNFATGSGAFSGAGATFSLADGASQMQQYNFNPVVRGLSTLVANVSASNGSTNGQNQAQSLAAQLSGIGVAPVASLNTSQANAGNVRVGTSGIAALTLKNVGDGNLSGLGASSNLNGNFATGSGAFSGAGAAFSLADGASRMQQYSFTPVTTGESTLSVALTATNGHSDGSNRAEVMQAQLTGTGVSPVFAASTATTIDFGTVDGIGILPMILSNHAPGQDQGALTALTLLSFSVTGPDANLFSLLNFAEGTRLGVGDSLALSIRFDGTGQSDSHMAMLSFITDEGAALGGVGNVREYSLMAAAVPEPTVAGMMLAGFACLGLMASRRRRLTAE